MEDTPFDIHQLDDLDYDAAEPILDDYQDTLINLFANSPEGQTYLETNPEMGAWIAQLIYYGYCYESFTLPKMTKNDVKTVVEGLFPRKVSLLSPEEADDAIPELMAFWQFLKREFKLSNAGSILTYLRQIQPKFKNIMNDSSRFGLAKSFFAMGQQAGFDMTTPEGLEKFQQFYNANIAPKIAAQNSESFGMFGGLLDSLAAEAGASKATSSKVPKEKQKKTRSTKQSRTRNSAKKK
ncbi:hypothetical protein [Coleofasciculus sp. H7-2]|uniref:hypothetical protein n=1 Tax=Coleofasciculus sp. H7-2 TaxID=3351545 RepID=UPI003670F6E1